MKRRNIIILLLLLVCVGVSTAQEEKKKDRKTVTLPKAGDIGLGIDMVPVLGYVGNLFNNTVSNSYSSFGGEPILDFNPLINSPSVSIMGKYMITDRIAARVNIGLLSKHTTSALYSIDDRALMLNPLSEAKVTDERIVNNTGAAFSIGGEYRRGYNRIQGFGGLNLIYAFGQKESQYNYGNAITDVNQVPDRNVWTAAPPAAPGWTQAYLLNHYNEGHDQYLGIGAHVGVEIFLASHFSIGGEVFLNAIWNFGSQEYMITEGFNNLNNEVETRTELISPGNTELTIGTENLGGKLYLMFYF